MRHKTSMTIALCFGVGLGLAPTVRSAHACSCSSWDSWSLELIEITGGAGDTTEEHAFWSDWPRLSGSGTYLSLSVGSIYADLVLAP